MAGNNAYSTKKLWCFAFCSLGCKRRSQRVCNKIIYC